MRFLNFGEKKNQNEQKPLQNTPATENSSVVRVTRASVPTVTAQYSRSTESGNKYAIAWPTSGASAVDVQKNRFRVMIAGDTLTASGFRAFYKEWIENAQQGGNHALFIADLEMETIPSDFNSIRELKYTGCSDYDSFFQRVKNMGSWLFITEDEDKAQIVRKASQAVDMHVRIYKLDSEGRLQNGRPSIQEEQEAVGHITPIADVFGLPNQMALIKEVVRKSRSVPVRSGTVYDSKRQPVMLRDEFLSNPQSITYQTDRRGMQAKIYQASYLGVTYFEDKAKKMLENRSSVRGSAGRQTYCTTSTASSLEFSSQLRRASSSSSR